MRIEGNVFLISGGASGLGAATASRLASAGGRVLIADINAAAGESLAMTLGDRARFVPVDVTEESQVQRAVDQAVSMFGELHGAISCAGVVIGERLVGRQGPHDLARFQKVMKVNATGTFNMMRLAAAAMMSNEAQEEERGVIINTASIAAFEGQIGQIAYAAAKSAIVGMTLPAARELAKFGIRVATIAPGIFDTPMMAGMPEAVREALGRQVPFPARLGTADEYAALVAHILENQMINGAVIRLDGAIRLAPK